MTHRRERALSLPLEEEQVKCAVTVSHPGACTSQHLVSIDDDYSIRINCDDELFSHVVLFLIEVVGACTIMSMTCSP